MCLVGCFNIIQDFDENDLCENLGWLAYNQEGIEEKLFSVRSKKAVMHPYN
jgi:hypothetical protein